MVNRIKYTNTKQSNIIPLLCINFIYLLGAAGASRIGFDNELGVDLTNAWMIYKGYIPYIDFFDLRASFAGNYLFAFLFKAFSPSYFIYRISWYVLGFFSINIFFFYLKNIIGGKWSAIALMTGFSYFLGGISSNPTHMFTPLLLLIGFPLFEGLFKMGKKRASVSILGVFQGVIFITEPLGSTTAVHILALLILSFYASGLKEYSFFILIHSSGFLIVILIVMLAFLMSGIDPFAMMWGYLHRLIRMSNTAVTMNTGSLLHPAAIYERHMSHWLGSFIYHLENFGLFSINTIKYILVNCLYYWLSLLCICYSMFLWMEQVFLSKKIFSLFEKKHMERLILVLGFFSAGIWSIEILRGAPFVNHTPQYAWQLNGILFVIVLFKFLRRSPACFIRVMGYFILFLVFSLGFKYAAENTWTMVNKDFFASKVPSLRWMMMSNEEMKLYSDTVETIQTMTKENDSVFVLGYDTNFYFLMNRESPVPEIVNLIMFADAPIENFNAKDEIENILTLKKAKYLIVPYYSEHPHSIKNEKEAVDRGDQGLAAIVLRRMTQKARQAFNSNYERIDSKRIQRFDEPHAHIYRLKERNEKRS